MNFKAADKPLLTFALAGFNQEKFIREAVQAAFAQTYSPLEIVLSDDNSEDRTFQIMRELAASYRGPHKIVLNQNPVRRSIGGHTNRIVEISHGELISLAAGDDISLPERTQTVYEAWEKSGRKATSIHSGIIQINEAGQVIEEVFKEHAIEVEGEIVEQPAEPLTYVQTLKPLIYGCAHTFSRELYTTFGNLPEEVIHEDNALGFRSILGGSLFFIGEKLVKYRLHGDNIYVRSRSPRLDLKSLERQENRIINGFKNREIMYKGFLRDLEKAAGKALIGKTDAEKVSAVALQRLKQVGLQREYLQSGVFGKCRILASLRSEKLDVDEMKLLRRRLVPRALLLRFRLLRSYAALAMGRVV